MNRIPVVLIHGAWLHMSSWKGWTERFSAHGYDVHVPNWPGEPDAVPQARRDPGPLGGFGLEELTAHYEKAVRALDTLPVLIGHSAGGLIARQLLDAGLARAAVAIAPMPGHRSWSALSVGGLTTGTGSYVPLPQPQFRHTVANAVGEEEAAQLFTRYVVPAPHRLLADLGLDDETPAAPDRLYNPDSPDGPASPDAKETPTAAPASTSTLAPTPTTARGPLLLISGQEDRVVADAVTRATYKLYGDSTAVTDLKQFADRGHSLVIDSGWPAVADYVLAWLAANGITAAAE